MCIRDRRGEYHGGEVKAQQPAPGPGREDDPDQFCELGLPGDCRVSNHHIETAAVFLMGFSMGLDKIDSVG